MSLFTHAYPGIESAPYPFMDAAVSFLGHGVTALLCALISTGLVFALGSRIFRSRFAGTVAAALFVLSPAVASASTHPEVAMFELTIVLLAVHASVEISRRALPKGVRIALVAVFALAAILAMSWGRFAAFATDAKFILGFAATPSRFARFALFAFATVPLAAVLLASRRPFVKASGFSRYFFHIGMTVLAALAVASPLSPSAVMDPYGLFPVAASAAVALSCGYLVSVWWRLRNGVLAKIVLAVFAFVLGFGSLFSFFTTDLHRGDFADELASQILDDLGERSWLVTDGSLDRNLKFVAAKRGKELHFIRLDRDDDRRYRARLAAEFRAAQPALAASSVIARSLDIGILAFIEDWISADREAARELAVFGAADIWCSAGLAPVAEFAFFGGDPARGYDVNKLNRFLEVLKAPAKWGSYRLNEVRNPVDRLRLTLRRHLGLCANNRAVELIESGRDDEAAALLVKVFTEVDTDNVSALVNLIILADRGNSAARKIRPLCDAALGRVVADRDRRFQLWRLSGYYGYIADPALFVRLGYEWAASGRHGSALGNLRRAIDMIPSERRATLMNMMAMLYAAEGDRKRSRELLTARLAVRHDDHDALIGMTSVSLADGELEQAVGYLERAVAAAGDDPRVALEKAIVVYMKGDQSGAEREFARIAASAGDNSAYALLASMMIERFDSEKDPERRAGILKELTDSVIPEMEKRAAGDDYFLFSTRGFVALRRGPEGVKDARRDLSRAMELRPSLSGVRETVLNLDIAAGDAESAERHARLVLRTDRNDALAHYVLGSLAFQRGETAAAEPYLKFAADAARPVSFAVNDLAELYRRQKDLDQAEECARRAVKLAPNFANAQDTLANVLLDRGGDATEAAECARKAVELSVAAGRTPEATLILTLLKAQVAKGDKAMAAITARKLSGREQELDENGRGELARIRSGL